MRQLRGAKRKFVTIPPAPIAEQMERRLLMSFTPYVSGGWTATPNYQFLNAVTNTTGTATPLGAVNANGAPLIPATMRSAYGLGTFSSSTNGSYSSSNPASGPTNYTYNYGISFNGIKGDGTGQTIAIVDVGSDPDIATDLQTFDAYYDLPNPPSFQQLSQTGSSTNLPGVAAGWPGEISLDVEWSHVMAPGANIILFAASDLYAAVQEAASYPGVSVVSMSFTISGNAPDSDFVTPSGHTGVSFFAGNGDSGAEVPSPAQSVNVVAVGGTNLSLNGSSYGSESAWSAGGGGISTSESQPAYQNGIVSSYSTTQRTTPDVSMDAYPGSGVAIVDSYDSGAAAPWELIIGGTSLATPLFAGVVANADQGRVAEGLTALDGGSQLLPRLYELSQANYSSNFHDVTTGNNGHPATAGYDLATGLGSAEANNLVPDLAGGDTITGQAFIDNNGNGTYDAGIDTPLAGKTVYLDLNGGGAQESIDPTAVTNSSGGYVFTDVVGSFNGVVRLAGTSGYLQENTAKITTAYDSSQTYNLAFVPTTTYTATASPTTTSLKSTLGVRISGTAATGLTYTWLAANEPEGAAPSFSPNGTAAAQNSTVTFNKAGTYILAVKITNSTGETATSSITVVVTQVLTSIAVIPPVPGVGGGQSVQLAVSASDQFGNPMSSSPSVTWTVVSGGGGVTPAGVFTAPAAGGIVNVKATTGSISATGNIDTVAMPWTPADIGTLANDGYAYDSNGTTTLNDSSDDIWNGSDDFLFDYQEIDSTNITMIAKLTTQVSLSGYVKAGLMIRNSLSSSDEMAMVADPYPSQSIFENRTTSGAQATQVNGPTDSIPVWLEITRSGSTFTGLISTNGTTWTSIGSQTIAMGNTVYVGLALTSHDTTHTATATFTNVSIASGQTLTSVSMIGSPYNMTVGQSQQLIAEGFDQNGLPMSSQPAFNWALTSGGGTLSSTGLYTATTGTLATVTASSGTLSATGTVAVVNSPWISTDIGTLGIPGLAYDSGTTTTLSDASDDIWNQSDDFHFDYQSMTGNGTITAELNSQTSASTYIKAGVMMRNSLAANDAMTMISDPAPGADFEWRTTAGGTAAQTVGASTNLPYWVRIVRNGNLFSGYISANGVTWGLVGTQTIAMNATIFVGLALTSHNAADLATAVFSNVSINNPTVATPAAATPNPVTGTSANLSVLGANTPNSAGESSLTYTWAATTVPAGAAAPTFSINRTNAAKNTTTTFFAAGSYTFTVTIADAVGDSITSVVSVVVNQTVGSIVVTPATASVYDAQTVQLAASAKDQFGNAIATQPGFTWSVAAGGVGTVSALGLYISPTAGAGTATVQASSGGITGSAVVTVNLSVIDGTTGDDTIRLLRSGANLLVYLNNNNAPLYTVAFSTLGSLTVAPSGGNDTVNVDFSGGATPVPAGGLSITGGGGTDSLIVTGTTGADTATVNATTVTFDGSVITYAGMNSIVIDGLGSTDVLTQAAQPGNAATLAFNGGTVDGTSATDTLNVNAGTYTFPAPATGAGIQPVPLAALSIANGASVILPTAADHGDRYVLMLGSLSLGGATSLLDLGGNDLILHNTDPTAAAAALTSVTAELASGFNGGAWNGNGISSSAIAESNNPLLTLGVIPNGIYSSFDNQPAAATDVIVKYTYYGDADLNGQLDGSDYSRIDNGYLNNLTGWYNGDFNNDGVIDGSDYTLIDNAFNTQGASLASEVASTATPTAALAVPSTALVARPGGQSPRISRSVLPITVPTSLMDGVDAVIASAPRKPAHTVQPAGESAVLPPVFSRQTASSAPTTTDLLDEIDATNTWQQSPFSTQLISE
jgi:hypothetical protein